VSYVITIDRINICAVDVEVFLIANEVASS
jgi:hypothetical protein